MRGRLPASREERQTVNGIRNTGANLEGKSSLFIFVRVRFSSDVGVSGVGFFVRCGGLRMTEDGAQDANQMSAARTLVRNADLPCAKRGR